MEHPQLFCHHDQLLCRLEIGFYYYCRVSVQLVVYVVVQERVVQSKNRHRRTDRTAHFPGDINFIIMPISFLESEFDHGGANQYLSRCHRPLLACTYSRYCTLKLQYCTPTKVDTFLLAGNFTSRSIIAINSAISHIGLVRRTTNRQRQRAYHINQHVHFTAHPK